MNNNLLSDRYQVSGSDYPGFVQEIKRISSVTKDIEVRGGSLTFLSLCQIPEAQQEGKIMFFVINKNNLEDFLYRNQPMRVSSIPANAISPELLEEAKNTTGLFLMHDNKLYVVSELAIPTMTLRAQVGGYQTINRNNLIRDIHIADCCIEQNDYIRFVFREEEIGKRPNGAPIVIRKIIAAMSGSYQYIPQTIVPEIIDTIRSDGSMGAEKVYFWQMSQEYTDIYLEYPQVEEDMKAAYKVNHDLIPGVFICTSDAGLSSIMVRGTYRVKGSRSYVVTDELMVRHTKKVEKDKILKAADKTVFQKFRKLPEVLATLMGKEVIDYGKIDLTSQKGQDKNTEAVSLLYKTVIDKLIKEKLYGKRSSELNELLLGEINPTTQYTLYDVAITFMEVSGRLEGLDRQSSLDLARNCAKVPFELEKIADGLNTKLVLASA